MLMIGIVKELLKLGSSKLPAYFFCQGTDLKLNNATAVLRGLIYMLIIQQPHLILYLRQKYNTEGQSLFEGPNAFYSLFAIFETMIEQVQQYPVHLLVDALDECQVNLENLLKFITKTVSMSPARVKWIISSRSMGHFERILDSYHGAKLLNLELNAGHISHAIETYINHEIEGLRILADEEILKHVKDQLNRKSDGTFLWVALVVEGLRKCEFEEEILDALVAIPKDLIGVYKKIINQINGLEHRRRDICMTVLSMAVLAYRPLHISEMRHLTGRHKEKDVERAVGLCGSFLTVRNGYIYLIHQSAKDFLDSEYTTSILPKHSEIHHQMYSQSREALSNKLKRDIYYLNNPGLLVPEIAAHRPDPDPLFDLRYSCTYWLDHFLKLRPLGLPEALDCQVSGFFERHLLHWLESLGLTGELRHGIISLKKLSACQSENQAIFKEAERFATANAVIIQETPLQIYSAALIFCPQESLGKRIYWNQRSDFIEKAYIMQESWDPCIQTLEGHKHSVNSVVFSPDGQIVASASDDGTIRLWDAATGAEKYTLEGHRDWVNSVAFSPDGQVVASASDDRTTRLWDAATGAEKHILKGHKDWVNAVAFSPDGQRVASASDDWTIRLWDVATSAEKHILEGHKDWVNAVAFSPDGQIVASASNDWTVRLWDTATGAEKQTLEGHKGNVKAVAFSPDGQIVASASNDKTIRLWDATTGAGKQIHYLNVIPKAMWFSADGCCLNSDRGLLLLGVQASYFPNKSIFVHEKWIERNGQRLVWLPPRYRASCAVARENKVILGHQSGALTFLWLN